MLSFAKRVYRNLRRLLSDQPPAYDFNTSNPLGGNGERVDIQMNNNVDFNLLDVYQKNHWRRYEFALQKIEPGDVCGDFACGTGYGSIILSDVVDSVIGADLDAVVISKIKKRYNNHDNVTFLNENLLNLNYVDHFDSIISFETLEHFDEGDLKKLLLIYSKALKRKGRLIFSTPYMLEQNELAMKMGFHRTFYIDEEKLKHWLKEAGLHIEMIQYQNYETHIITNELDKKDFIICVARKQDHNA